MWTNGTTGATELQLPAAAPAIAPVPLPTAESTASPVPIDREPTAAVAVKWRDGTFSGLGYSPASREMRAPTLKVRACIDIFSKALRLVVERATYA
jgi:hypothetical protein